MSGRATSDTFGLIASRLSKLLSPESARGGNHVESASGRWPRGSQHIESNALTRWQAPSKSSRSTRSTHLRRFLPPTCIVWAGGQVPTPPNTGWLGVFVFGSSFFDLQPVTATVTGSGSGSGSGLCPRLYSPLQGGSHASHTNPRRSLGAADRVHRQSEPDQTRAWRWRPPCGPTRGGSGRTRRRGALSV